MEKYYSEKTIKDFIEDCKDINGNIDLNRFNRYLTNRFDIKLSDEFIQKQKNK